MSQQIPMVDNQAFNTNKSFVRRLFVETGYGWLEIANSVGKTIEGNIARNDQPIARIVEEYTPPSPTAKNTEIKLANGQSIIHGTGKASFRISLRLLFPDALNYSNFMFFMGNSFKFYDERGGIYKCAIAEQPSVSRVEAGRRYDVKMQLMAVRKDIMEEEVVVEFTDLTVNAVHTIELVNYGNVNPSRMFTIQFDGLGTSVNITLPPTGGYQDTGGVGTGILGGVSVDQGALVNGTIEGFIMPKLIAERLIEVGYADYFGIDYSYNKIVLTPKIEAYKGITFIKLASGIDAVVTTSGGKHWAYNHIIESAQAGIVNFQDGRGDRIYTFRPSAKATRAEAVTMLNNTRKWIEKMIRG